MNSEQLNHLNNNPYDKINYLESLLKLNQITPQQRNKINNLIYKTKILLQQKSGFINQGTRDLNITNNNINDKIKLEQSYLSETEKQQKEFEERIRREKEEFIKKQNDRRKQFEQAMKLFENQYTNALNIFKLGSDYNEKDLKNSYKSLALKYHPDRGGKDSDFQYITKCYILLKEQLNKNTEKTQDDLRYNYNPSEVLKPMPNTQFNNGDMNQMVNDRLTDHFRDLSANRTQSSNNSLYNKDAYLQPSNKNFNTYKFNSQFEANKLWSPNDDGYGEWMNDNKIMEDPLDNKPKKEGVFNKKFCIDVFNSTFEQKCQNKNTLSTHSNRQLDNYKPQELTATQQSSYTWINGDDKIEDFSKPIDSQGDLTGMSYTDYKKAYSNGGSELLITVGLDNDRKQYKTVKELEKERENIRYEMNEQERLAYEQQLRINEERERERLKRVQYHDKIHNEHYHNTHQTMLGYKNKDNEMQELLYN